MAKSNYQTIFSTPESTASFIVEFDDYCDFCSRYMYNKCTSELDPDDPDCTIEQLHNACYTGVLEWLNQMAISKE